MTSPKPFTKSFTQQEAMSDSAMAAALEVLKSGRLHRYNVADGEEGETAQFEQEYAQWQGAPYCLAVASGGQAIQIALRAAGVQSGDIVLTNSFTLAPVPGAIAALGARPLFIETNKDLKPDLEDLKEKATLGRYLLLSHMRGHLAPMDQIAQIAKETGLKVIEDCAHTMGARFDGIRSGNVGLAGCFSTQTYKHLNSGEGGLITTADADFMAKCILYSGSYMLYGRHLASPNAEHFEPFRASIPNLSARMDNLRAAILRPQLKNLDHNIKRWNERYQAVERILLASNDIRMPKRHQKEEMASSSIQFFVPQFDEEQCEDFVERNKRLGVELKWFGAQRAQGYTSTYRHWHYTNPSPMPQTDQILARLFDMRLPLTFSSMDCEHLGMIISHCVRDG